MKIKGSVDPSGATCRRCRRARSGSEWTRGPLRFRCPPPPPPPPPCSWCKMSPLKRWRKLPINRSSRVAFARRTILCFPDDDQAKCLSRMDENSEDGTRPILCAVIVAGFSFFQHRDLSGRPVRCLDPPPDTSTYLIHPSVTLTISSARLCTVGRAQELRPNVPGGHNVRGGAR